MSRIAGAAFLIVLSAALAPAPARAEAWVAFFIIPEGVVYLDRDSVTRSPGRVSARLESTFPKPQLLQRGGVVFRYLRVVDRVEVDCRARVYTNVSRDLYSDIGVQQLSLDESDNPMPVAPRSAQDALIKAFCS